MLLTDQFKDRQVDETARALLREFEYQWAHSPHLWEYFRNKQIEYGIKKMINRPEMTRLFKAVFGIEKETDFQTILDFIEDIY